MISGLLAVVAITVIAIIAGRQADPSKLSCQPEDTYQAPISLLGGGFKTPEKALAFVQGSLRHGAFPSDYTFIEVTDEALAASGGRQFAGQLDGQTKVLVTLSHLGGTWGLARAVEVCIEGDRSARAS